LNPQSLTNSLYYFHDFFQENLELINHLLNNSVDPAIWNIEEDPHAALAKVIVLDQFSRSAHRGTANAFAGDEICAALVRRMVISGSSEEDSTGKMHNWFFDKFTPMEQSPAL
jgi:uncharacterized protein (DUF924 family)